MTEVMETFQAEPVIAQPEFRSTSAGFWMRFWAFVLDSLVISAIVGIIINRLFHLMDWNLASSDWYAPIVIISGVIYYSYFILLTKFLKQTLGKMVFGLRVQKDNGEPLDWVTVVFRECVGRFINNTFFHLPYIVVGFTPNNKSIADYFADTKVVHEKLFEPKNNSLDNKR